MTMTRTATISCALALLLLPACSGSGSGTQAAAGGAAPEAAGAEGGRIGDTGSGPATPVRDGAASPETSPEDAAAPATAPEPQAPATAPGAPPPGTPAPSRPADPNSAAARVNGVPITARELGEAVAQFLRTQGAPESMADDRLRGMVLDALIGRELLYQKSQAEGITAAPEEVANVLGEMKGQFASPQAFTESLAAQGIDEAAFSALVARNIVIEKGIKASVVDKVAVSDEDVRRYYESHPGEMSKPAEIRASHVLFRVPEGAAAEAKGQVRERAEAALAKVKAGEDFAAIARQSSEDPGSAPNGGDLGYFPRGRMVAPFDEAAFGLASGQVSGLVETRFGYHIIKITDRRDARQASLEEVAAPLRGFLEQKKAREDMESLVKTLRASAKVEVF
jgi:peptidyl-prolyl cis-trans isomerase C